MLEKRFEVLPLAKKVATYRLLEWPRRLGTEDRPTAVPALATIPVVDARCRRGATTGGRLAAGYSYGERVARLPKRWERWERQPGRPSGALSTRASDELFMLREGVLEQRLVFAQAAADRPVPTRRVEKRWSRDWR